MEGPAEKQSDGDDSSRRYLWFQHRDLKQVKNNLF